MSKYTLEVDAVQIKEGQNYPEWVKRSVAFEKYHDPNKILVIFKLDKNPVYVAEELDYIVKVSEEHIFICGQKDFEQYYKPSN